MSRRRPGYDKYYSDVSCATCGGYTGVEYADRFGEDEPTVYCDTCKANAMADKKEDARAKWLVPVTCTYCDAEFYVPYPDRNEYRPLCLMCRDEDDDRVYSEVPVLSRKQ